jgi:hypothetical protein
MSKSVVSVRAGDNFSALARILKALFQPMPSTSDERDFPEPRLKVKGQSTYRERETFPEAKRKSRSQSGDAFSNAGFCASCTHLLIVPPSFHAARKTIDIWER